MHQAINGVDSDEAVEGLFEGVQKLVDDILIEGKTLEELSHRITKVIENCRT